jgi:hypothetical protein
MRLRTLAAAVALALMSVGAGLLPAVANAAPANSAPPGEVKRLVGEFRGAVKQPEKRPEIVQRAIQAGPAAANGIMTAISREMAPQVNRYLGKFSQKAAPLAKKLSTGVKIAEVEQLRQTVLGLKDAPNFTHETITAKADPAMKRLRDLFVLGREAVLAQTPELQKDREKLLGPARLWDQCAACVYQHLPDDAKKPRGPPSFERYLCGEEDVAALLAIPADGATRNTLTNNAPKTMQLDAEEARAIWEANITRLLLGLTALEIDPKLCAAARDHSHDMETLKFFAHESPVEGKKTPWDRARRMGTEASGENIYTGGPSGQAAHEGWFHSPPHQTNMLGAGHRRIGLGRSGGLFTEMFGD